MSTTCPVCRSTIATDDINVSTDLALCRACGKSFRFSEIVSELAVSGPDLNAPPAGAWYQPLPDGFTVGASTRTWQAAFLIPFTCVWSGFSMSGIYGSQIAKGHFDLGSSLFGIPFLIGTCVLISLCALYSAGRVAVTLSSGRLSIFTGVGLIGWTRSYSWSEFRTVREDLTSGAFNTNRRGKSIYLEGSRRVGFGSLLSDERRYFVASALRANLSKADRSSGFGGSLAEAGRYR